MIELKLWAEVGVWETGAAMLILSDREGGDGHDILHEVPLDFPEEARDDHANLPYQEELKKLGYQPKPNVPGQYTVAAHASSAYGYIFEIEAL